MEPIAEESEESGLPIEEVENAVLEIYQNFITGNESYRTGVLQRDKKAQLYWEGIQNIWWSDSARDYKQVNDLSDTELDEYGLDGEDERNVNIYKAHGEAIIAALSAQVPGILWFPEDADNPNDTDTSKAYSAITDLIRRHNRYDLILIKALFCLYNQEYCAAYLWNDRRREYGVDKTPINATQIEKRPHTICPECGSELSDLEGISDPVECPVCGAPIVPEIEEEEFEISVIVGESEEYRRRTKIEVFGSLHVEIPPHCKKQSEIPVLILREDVNLSSMLDRYQHLREEGHLDDTGQSTGGGIDEREARRVTQSDDYSSKVVTKTTCWIRPWHFWDWGTDNSEKVEGLQKRFPKGCKAVFVGDTLAEIIHESMDDHWSICASPLSNTVAGVPLGRPELPIQEMKTELLDLGLQTIEYGIPMLFADPAVVGFDAFKNSRANPGSMYPAQPEMGQGIKDSIFETRPTTLAQEVSTLDRSLDEAGQFAVGSFPSIYGGSISGGSKTAREYTESRAMALQRLSITWKQLSYWTVDVFSIGVELFLKDLKSDQKFVEKNQTGFVNVWIRQSELQGKVGNAEPEASDQFPISWSQRRDMFIEIMQMQIPEISSAIFAPQNLQHVSSVLGFPDFYIPGADDRNKQHQEILTLTQAEVIQLGVSEETGQPEVQSSVGIEPFLDNHLVQAQVCRAFLVSPQGRDLQSTNPGAFNNVLTHMLEHEGAQEALNMMQAPEEGPDNS
jgi:hypothetical protein|tara:strand:+ start:170 stop:2374 length:2205 start_codon:yes stop_codon:yes gene_type:complete